MNLLKTDNKKTLAFIGLIFVVLMWGVAPLCTMELNKHYSPTFKVAITELLLLITYLTLSRNHFKEFNIDYLKVGIPTGIFLAFANICQKVGLLYTTPAKFAFLENLSCITVPILMYILIKKKPTLMTIASCIVCLVSVFVLNGVTLDGGWGIGEILCAMAGLLFGFNIAGTGAFAKKFYVPLYLATQSVVGFIVSIIASLIFNFIPMGPEHVIIERITFSFDPKWIIFLVLFVVVNNALCWIIRTNSMKHIDASAVAVIMPFSAVVTSVLSVMLGSDQLTLNIVLGGALGLAAIFLSSFGDK